MLYGLFYCLFLFYTVFVIVSMKGIKMTVNFTSGLVKVNKTYINPSNVRYFQEKERDMTKVVMDSYVDGKDHKTYDNQVTLNVKPNVFAKAMIEAQKSGNVIDIKA